jgi:hypothetical protein
VVAVLEAASGGSLKATIRRDLEIDSLYIVSLGLFCVKKLFICFR